LQLISYLLTLIVIISKNKITKNQNIYEKNLSIFHCSEIIISFLYLEEKLMQIYEDNSLHISIIIIVLFFNCNIIIYFILVEIINCKYDEIIIEIIWALIINISLYYFIFYILKKIIFPKKITSFLFRNIFGTTFAFIIILILSFGILFYFNELEYFFSNKILMKIIGFLFYLLFELLFLFRDKADKSIKYFNLYNIYSNSYLYSKTTKIKLFARVAIIILLEYFLLFKLDFPYKLNMELNQCILIILFDILHGFIITFIIKYIFNLLFLNNTDLINLDSNIPLMRFGSVSSIDQDGFPPLIFE
jgi:hypothetical protein